MKKRGLDEPSVTRGAFKPSEQLAPLREGPDGDSLTEEDETENGDLPHEYTWKTELCECAEREEAWQIREVFVVLPLRIQFPQILQRSALSPIVRIVPKEVLYLIPLDSCSLSPLETHTDR